MIEQTRSELITALEALQSYCDATLCNKCIFNRPEIKESRDYCMLCADFPAYWDTAIHKLKEQIPNGWWAEKPLGVVCSRCKAQALHSPNGNQLKSDFCPNCGALMRKEGEAE